MNTFVDAFQFIGDHTGLLLAKTAEHLELSGAALGIALVLALPLGLWLGHKHRGLGFATGVSTLGRALPSTVLIAFGLTLFGFGFWNTAAALVVLAVPPILTNAYLGIDTIDRDVVEAARGMGMSDREVLRQVELPLGLPLIFGGIKTSTINVIATATIAPLAGVVTLGDPLVSFAVYGYEGQIGVSIIVAALAIAAELGLSAVQRAVTPKGIKPERASRARFGVTKRRIQTAP
jgi:osmoprotectant transport system permease protein